MNSLKLLIADDEQPARSRLRQLLEEIDGWQAVAEAQNGHEVIDICNRIQPDVVLLDIRMPNMDCIETARHLGTLDKTPAVIFTTAYDEYAVDAFDAQAIGYLLKPVRRERLERALKLAARLTLPQLSALAQRDGIAQSRTHICANIPLTQQVAEGNIRLTYFGEHLGGTAHVRKDAKTRWPFSDRAHTLSVDIVGSFFVFCGIGGGRKKRKCGRV